jgi:hypothetical protein
VPLTFFIFIGILAGLAAATMAFLITFEEYSRHQNIGKRKTLLMSLEIAIAIFAVFFIISLVIGFVMSKE